jgi:hypothetical protein
MKNMMFFAMILTAISAQAEFKRLEMTVFGMD